MVKLEQDPLFLLGQRREFTIRHCVPGEPNGERIIKSTGIVTGLVRRDPSWEVPLIEYLVEQSTIPGLVGNTDILGLRVESSLVELKRY